ncbi:MAG: HAMP domain-containing protein [Acidobacteria bacterium]|nr:HAMP domain-containing protein [Acidobacteriota bacterium]
MRRSFLYFGGLLLFVTLVALIVWLGSFHFDLISPSGPDQTVVAWAVSILIFILTVTLGFMLARTFVRLAAERRGNREGYRIRTRLVVGAVALSVIPVFFMVLFSIYVLNNTMRKWFSRPVDAVIFNLADTNVAFEQETMRRARAQAEWLALRDDVRQMLETGLRPPTLDAGICREHAILQAVAITAAGVRLPVCSAPPAPKDRSATSTMKTLTARAASGSGFVEITAQMSRDLAARQQLIETEVHNYRQLDQNKRQIQNVYIQLLLLISLFILWVAAWIAVQMAKQISQPIATLVEAAGQLRRGNLDYRIQTPAAGELGTLVRAFNDMAADVQSSERELERRRNFTEAILESIPTGVISLSAERRIQRANSALAQILGPDRVANALRLEDLFPAEHAHDLHRLLNRARRTGVATQPLDIDEGGRTHHLAVTVSAVSGKHSAGWVLVIEDTSELLRAQRAAAWHEVARRIAHEIKNPLTPIALSAERIARQIEKAEAGAGVTPDILRIVRQCSLTITGEVQSVKSLVDEFSQFARFPAAQPQPSDLNEVVESALAVFAGRLDGVEVVRALRPDLPLVAIDREQFRRIVINLVDNAAEAMQDSTERQLTVSTALAGPDTVELSVADTGHGISPDDRERLFLPYFSTRNRGTGLGLAIVHHIVQDHGAQIRVEDNRPAGARFIVDISALVAEVETPVT